MTHADQRVKNPRALKPMAMENSRDFRDISVGMSLIGEKRVVSLTDDVH